MAKKTKIVEEAVDLNEELEGEASEITWFDYDASAYTVLRNENGTFDLAIIRIDSDTNQAIIEREPTRYDSVLRALLDIGLKNEQEIRNNRGKK